MEPLMILLALLMAALLLERKRAEQKVEIPVSQARINTTIG